MLLGEDGAAPLLAESDGAELLSSVLLVLEARRNLVRLARDGALSAGQYKTCLGQLDEDQRAFVLRDLTFDLGASAAMPAVGTPRSLDLAHLRSALWFHAEEPIARFVTLDDSQQEAARELGLPVE